MPFVSITRLRVRRWRYVPQFLIQSIRAARQAKRAAGNLAVSVLRDADRTFWTRTVWRDEAAMRSFMHQACIVALWRGSRIGAMRPPWSIGFKIPTNRHPGRRHIAACKGRAGVRGSGTRRRPNAGLRSGSRGPAAGLRSSDR